MSTRTRFPTALFAFALVFGSGLLLAPRTASAQFDLEVIYSEIASSPTSDVPGALDLAGQPAAAKFLSMLDLFASPTGDQWVLRGSTDQGSDLANFMILGVGDNGSMFAQEGQPVAGGVPGELYEFFDGVGSFNSAGNFAYGARARAGDPTIKEKVIVFDGLNSTIVATESSPVTGLQDSTGPAGDETLGNSLNSIHLLDNGSVGYVAVTISNVSSANRPALFYDLAAFAQSGFTPIGADTWDGFDSNEFFTTADGLHWFAMGDTFTSPDVLAVDGAIVLSNGVVAPGTTDEVDAIFHTKMLPDGSWIARGDFADNTDWVVADGVLIARTGDPIFPGSTESWSEVISSAYRAPNGQTFIAGGTDSADPAADLVLVELGNGVIAREGDPIDLDGNGVFDDDVFVRSFKPNSIFLEGGNLRFLATLQNGLGDSLGDAFLRKTLVIADPIFSRGDCNGDGGFNIADAIFLLGFLFPVGPPTTLSCDDACDANDDGGLNIADAIRALEALFPGGTPMPLVAPFPGCGFDPTGDSLDCGSSPSCP